MCSLPVNLGRWPFSVTYCWNVWAAVTDDGNADSSSLQATCISRLLLPLQKKLYFLWQGNSPWHFFFFSIVCPEKPTRGSPHDSCGCSVCQPEPICWQWAGKQTLSLCNCEKLPEHDTTIRWSAMVQTTSKTLVCITHIYIYIWHIHVNICINRHIFEFKNLTIYFNSWSG